MHYSRTLIGALALSFASLGAHALTAQEAAQEKDRIEAQYKAAKEACRSQQGNAKDICELQAKGNEKTAKAELEARRDPSEKNLYKARLAHAEAEHDIAKERCDDLQGNAKDVCKKDAQAAFVQAKEAAKVRRAQETPNTNASEKAADIAETRKDAIAETRDAQYKAAKERCDSLSGDTKDKCISDAKARFGEK